MEVRRDANPGRHTRCSPAARSRRGGSGLVFAVAIIVGSLGVTDSGKAADVAGSAKAPSGTRATEAQAQPVIFQMHWCPQAQFAGYMMAVEKGYFRQEGLSDLRLRWSTPGERPFERLMTGESDYCTGWLADAIVERDRGLRLVNLAQVLQQSSLMLIARRRSGIDSPAAFGGKRIGLWGGNFDVQATALFRKYKVEPVLVAQSTSIVPFLRGAVDVASAMRYNEYHQLLEAGMLPDDLRTFPFSDYGFVFPEDGIYCSEATRREREDSCAGLVHACRRGWEYALANESETLDVVMRICRAANVRTNRNHQRWMLRSIGEVIWPRQPSAAAWGTLDQKAYAEVVRLLEAQTLVRTPPEFRVFHQPPGAVARGIQD